MIKIAHIINSKIYSGLENVVCTIMEYFKQNYKDIDMIYVTQDGPIADVLKEKKLKYYIIEKMNTKNINKFIKEYKPDILHAHDFTASVICALTNTRIPIINHLHNNAPWIKKINVNSIAYLYAGLRAKKILTVSSSIENEYIFSKFIKNKIDMVGNPVSRKKILDMVSEDDYNKIYDICCIGRIVEQKNPKRFIDIIYKLKKKIPNIKAVWVGNGEMYEEIINYRDKMDLKENIEFVGFKKNPYTYLATSKIFLLTSSTEGYGLVAFEALTLGVPCVVSNIGGLPSIVDNSCGKLCNIDKDFIDEVSELICNHDYYVYKQKKSREKSAKLDNFSAYMQNINAMYESLFMEGM